MKNFIKKPVFIFLLIVVAIIVGGYFYFSKDKKPNYEFITAQRGEIIQEVSVTGRVKPAEEVNLAFERSGRVSDVYVGIGKRVAPGQILAKLDDSEILSQLAQAQAELKVQKARLDELKRGVREEEIKIQEIKVENAKISLEEARKNLIDKIQDAYTRSDDAIRNKVDQFFINPRSSNPQTAFSIADFQLDVDIKWQRLLVEEILKNWQSSLNQLNSLSDLNSYLNNAKNNLNQIKSFLDKVALAVNSLTVSATNIPQSKIDSWRIDVSSARTNINLAISNLSAAEEKFKIAEANFALTQQELAFKKSGATDEQIKAQEAQVEKAQANILNYEVQLGKTLLRSPIAGVVTKQEAKIGEIVLVNTPIISIISDAQFRVEANIPEADIAKVKINDPAQITFDAYGEEVVFGAKVINIEPAGNIVEGVTTYKIILQFNKEDKRIKSGMTANINILAAKAEGVIVIPQRAVITRNGEKIVRLLEGEVIKEVMVKTGLRGSDGNIEIIEGIKEGDRVIYFIK